ncbi:MAG TPA: glutamine-hydrolyzing carbamoyl-phosphate synthase small subunit [Thermomicrobiales bacterium]|nr:glutamine-hydrolyzing carbamoyl-phosphate synthase small subunit [Thermomicrobiales bacterium]
MLDGAGVRRPSGCPAPTRYRPPTDAALALADGRVFRGRAFGAKADGLGEVVFTTTMVGYQEVCTDPSFRGQLVCMTYPLIGNYGVNAEDDESRQPWISGLIVREAAAAPSHHRAIGTIDDYLKRHGIPGICEVDTRALTRHIRNVGDIRASLVSDAASFSDSELIEMAQHASLPAERDVVGDVVLAKSETVGAGDGPHIVVVDCGVKRNIIRSLVERGAKVTIVPFDTSSQAIAALEADGVVVSPGPGDPAALDGALGVVRDVVQSGIPYFGICLGHQLLARSIGATTTKLKFGHRGGNHPVRDEQTGRVTITSQNHGYQVEAGSIPTVDGWRVALVNLNDGSVEGLAHQTLPAMTVQFHPESSPGPLDNDDLFDRFLEMVDARKAKGAGVRA